MGPRNLAFIFPAYLSQPEGEAGGYLPNRSSCPHDDESLVAFVAYLYSDVIAKLDGWSRLLLAVPSPANPPARPSCPCCIVAPNHLVTSSPHCEYIWDRFEQPQQASVLHLRQLAGKTEV